MRTEVTYGFFSGGDPRKFRPDAESCMELELEAHRKACALWDEAEARGETPTPEACPSGWIVLNGTQVHVLRAPYGIGTYEFTYDDGEAEHVSTSSGGESK